MPFQSLGLKGEHFPLWLWRKRLSMPEVYEEVIFQSLPLTLLILVLLTLPLRCDLREESGLQMWSGV
jgi:hypothetical protein